MHWQVSPPLAYSYGYAHACASFTLKGYAHTHTWQTHTVNTHAHTVNTHAHTHTVTNAVVGTGWCSSLAAPPPACKRKYNQKHADTTAIEQTDTIKATINRTRGTQ